MRPSAGPNLNPDSNPKPNPNQVSGAAFRWPEARLDLRAVHVLQGGGGRGQGQGRGGGGSGGGGGGRAARAAEAKAAAAAAARRAAGEEGAEGAAAEAARPPTLPAVSLRIAQGALVGVSGGVGCGKTSLLLALLDEVPRLHGRVCVRGAVAYCAQVEHQRDYTLAPTLILTLTSHPHPNPNHVAYCAQEPWVQNATLRDNVLFGAAWDAAWYEQVIDACALRASPLTFHPHPNPDPNPDPDPNPSPSPNPNPNPNPYPYPYP